MKNQEHKKALLFFEEIDNLIPYMGEDTPEQNGICQILFEYFTNTGFGKQ